jgi:hypothetical protein
VKNPLVPRIIVVLRHAEKPGPPDAPDTAADPNLSEAGRKRAEMLKTRIPEVCGGPPDFIFAAANTSKSHRPVETMEPLASTLRSDCFVTKYADDEYRNLAHELLTDAIFAGKSVVICWRHGNIPGLTASLGVDEAQMRAAPEYHHGKWSDEVFDRFWMITYPAAGGAQFVSEPQSPVPGQ